MYELYSVCDLISNSAHLSCRKLKTEKHLVWWNFLPFDEVVRAEVSYLAFNEVYGGNLYTPVQLRQVSIDHIRFNSLWNSWFLPGISLAIIAILMVILSLVLRGGGKWEFWRFWVLLCWQGGLSSTEKAKNCSCASDSHTTVMSRPHKTCTQWPLTIRAMRKSWNTCLGVLSSNSNIQQRASAILWLLCVWSDKVFLQPCQRKPVSEKHIGSLNNLHLHIGALTFCDRGWLTNSPNSKAVTF